VDKPTTDGFPVGFSKNHWETIGGEVGMLVLDVLNSGLMPENL
jgi:hypothetical protein